jgi:4-diphosphocytidyl-2-C-methyl-D-erythritol kinase
MRLLLKAHAKVNWTLEIIGKRQDGYHEIRTVLQTIDLADTLIMRDADSITLRCNDTTIPEVTNLALRAAQLLQSRTQCQGGAAIELQKNIPIAAGLGGGSSDAAAVLRGLCQLWQLGLSDQDLAEIASGLGSDVAFFLRGGTALAQGRGEQVEPLPDMQQQRLVIAWLEAQRHADKTARMYAAVSPDDYSSGHYAERLRTATEGGSVQDGDLYNAFEQVLDRFDPVAAQRFERSRPLGVPHLCGSGPAFYFLSQSVGSTRRLLTGLRDQGLHAIEARTVGATESSQVDMM